jgi:uncharacterized membrane protein
VLEPRLPSPVEQPLDFILTRDHAPPKNTPTLGERLADQIAAFGGSWTFITLFFGILLGWILLNLWFLDNEGFDPFPFILLNLILSCLAAIQAPIIMMSQNRKEQKDRQRAELDLKINQTAEREIRELRQKVDELHTMLEKWTSQGSSSR